MDGGAPNLESKHELVEGRLKIEDWLTKSSEAGGEEKVVYSIDTVEILNGAGNV